MKSREKRQVEKTGAEEIRRREREKRGRRGEEERGREEEKRKRRREEERRGDRKGRETRFESSHEPISHSLHNALVVVSRFIQTGGQAVLQGDLAYPVFGGDSLCRPGLRAKMIFE